jgi:hypothetical protein
MSLFTKGVFTKNLNVGIGTSSNKIHSHESIPNTPNYIQVSNNDTDGLTMGVNGLNSEINSIGDLVIKTTNEIRLDSAGNFSIGTALSTTATDGFLYVPGAPGIPSGIPTTKSGLVPITFDTVSNKMYTSQGTDWDDVSGNTLVFPVKSGVNFVNIGLATYLNQAGEVVFNTTIEPSPITFIGVNATTGTSTIRVVLSGKASLYIPEPIVSDFFYSGTNNSGANSDWTTVAQRLNGNTSGTITAIQFYTNVVLDVINTSFKGVLWTNGNSSSMTMTLKESSPIFTRAELINTEAIVDTTLYQYTISGLNLSYDAGDLYGITCNTSVTGLRRSLSAAESGLDMNLCGVSSTNLLNAADGQVTSFSNASTVYYMLIGYKSETDPPPPPLVAATGDFAVLDSSNSNFLATIPSNTLVPSTHIKVGVLLNPSTIYLQ